MVEADRKRKEVTDEFIPQAQFISLKYKFFLWEAKRGLSPLMRPLEETKRMKAQRHADDASM